jgi:TonB-linked SusC/RagA family outer membrane protein
MKKNESFRELFYSSLKKTFLTMRIAIILLMLGILQARATNAYSQKTKLSLNFSDAQLITVLDKIENESEYFFLYNEKLLDTERKVTINEKDKLITDILDILFKSTDVNFTILDRKIILAPDYLSESSQQTQNRITGTVTDKDGAPLTGVNVVVTGSTQGTITDIAGKYRVEVPQGARSLTFSFIGMQSQEISIGTSTLINVTMAETVTGLEEVVVVGYGVQKKANVVGAVSSVKLRDISTRPYANLTNVLQGSVPGLNIKVTSLGGDPTITQKINVRGFNSINGGQPLVLIDGIESDISNINPNDIESVSVLKDAQSAAIYGARGAFGVVLITTNKATSGKFNIRYSNNFSLSTNTARTDFVTNPYVVGQAIETAIKRYNNSSYFPGYTAEDWEILRKVGDGEIEPYYEKKPDGTYRFYEQTDFYHIMFREWRPSMMHNITINGGSEKLSGYISGRILDEATDQNLPKVSNKRYNLNVHLEFKPYDWLEIGGGTKFNQKNNIIFGGGIERFSDPHNDFWILHDLYPNYPAEIDGIGVDVGRAGEGSDALNCAQFDGAHSYRQWKINNYINDLIVKITPIENFNINFQYSYDNNLTDQTDRDAPFKYLKSNRLVLTTFEGRNRLGVWHTKDLHQTLNIFGTYTQNVKDKHHFKLMLGYNQEKFREDKNGAQVENLPSNDKASLGLGDKMFAISGSTLDWDIKGYYGRFNYDYNEKYLLEVNSRLDGSSRFPTENQWGFFPSIGLGWRVSKENFWSQSKIFSDLKIRTSYGSLGNQDVPVNTFLRLVTMGLTSWIDEGIVTKYARAPNPLPSNIGWEKVNSTNVGLDLGFFNNKLLASFDLYQRTTSEMYLPGQPLPAVFGAAEPKRNYASLRNRGGEVSLTYNNSFKVLGSELSFRVEANISNDKSVITKFDNPTGLLSTFWEGQVLGEVWGYHIDGQFQSDEEAAAYQASFSNDLANNLRQVYSEIFSGSNTDWMKLRAGNIKYIDLNEDGKITNGKNTLDDHGDLKKIGNFMPKFPFGLSVNVGWKGFNLSVIGQGIGKQDWYPRGPTYWAIFRRPYQSFIRKDLLDHVWDPDAADNSKNIYPQIKGYTRSCDNFNDYYLTNIGYVRIKNLTISYNIPEKIIKKVGVQGLRLFFSGENIFTFTFQHLTKYIDPELAGSAIDYSDPNLATGTRGFDTEPYPISKSFSFGIVLDL